MCAECGLWPEYRSFSSFCEVFDVAGSEDSILVSPMGKDRRSKRLGMVWLLDCLIWLTLYAICLVKFYHCSFELSSHHKLGMATLVCWYKFLKSYTLQNVPCILNHCAISDNYMLSAQAGKPLFSSTKSLYQISNSDIKFLCFLSFSLSIVTR
jgi:hypothetical protein